MRIKIISAANNGDNRQPIPKHKSTGDSSRSAQSKRHLGIQTVTSDTLSVSVSLIKMKTVASFFYCLLSQAVNALTKRKANDYGYKRTVYHNSKLNGIVNWELLNRDQQSFSPRHSHATTIFKCPDNPLENCIWLTGGFSEPHRAFDLQIENENCDVWWSRNGETWHQMTDLNGDYLRGVGNWDAKPNSYVAPWFSRYGHTLDALDGDLDGNNDVMILAGGNSPMPSNDVWITRNGRHWNYDGKAPWSKRAYHASVVYRNKLFILGGTPLSNDVWSASLVKDKTRDSGYTLKWNQEPDAPWSIRAGLCAVSQLRYVNKATGTAQEEQLYVIGGFAHQDDGIRTVNDVWKTVDGSTWLEVSPSKNLSSMPWRGRAFHGCTTWSSMSDRARWVSADSLMHLSNDNLFAEATVPRIFITGGGYMGSRGNNQVRSLEAHSDTWWSTDGSQWNRVNYEEGSRYDNNVFSTNEWTETVIDGKKGYRGKWGHTLEVFHSTQDIDLDQKIATTNVSLNICNDLEDTTTQSCKRISAVESEIPTLFTIGGKLESGPMVNDVFVSRQGIHCEIEGVTCSQNGVCGPASLGCVCRSGNFTGEYCTFRQAVLESDETSAASRPCHIFVTVLLAALAPNWLA